MVRGLVANCAAKLKIQRTVLAAEYFTESTGKHNTTLVFPNSETAPELLPTSGGDNENSLLR